MDNLTHSLVGLVAGELIARTLRPTAAGLSDGSRRVALISIGVLGGNLPDSDLAWSMSAVTGDTLAYLLEHRGYTHTLPGCGLLAAGLFAATLGVLRWRGQRESVAERWLLAAMAVLAVLLHVAMDALNSYGVHPFWPWNNRWFYGDAVFIIEPLYWLATAPLLLALYTLRARLLLGLALLVGSVALLIVHGFGLLWWTLPLGTAALVWFSRHWSARRAVLTSVALMATITGAFIAASVLATARIDAIASRQFPGFETLDRVLSPLPVQPLCWDVLLVQRSAETYVVRRGQFALTGSVATASCPQLFGSAANTAPLQALAAGPDPALAWRDEFSLPLATLRRLAAADCRAGELLQFVRAPFAVETAAGWVLGDLRFDREPGLGMAELLLRPDDADDCHYHVPWLPPRADLLTP